MDADKLKDTLTNAEGRIPYLYNDATGRRFDLATGNLTVGIGHNCMGQWPTDLIDLIYTYDAAVAERACRAFWPLSFDQFSDARQRALIEMAFSLGQSRFAQFEHFIAAVKQQDWKSAAVEIRNSVVYRQLQSRYERIATMIETGKDQ